MPLAEFTAEYYRERAAHLRKMAGESDEPKHRAQLLGLARDYDDLARRAQERLEGASGEAKPQRRRNP